MTKHISKLLFIIFFISQVCLSQTLPTNTDLYKSKQQELNLDEFLGSKYLNENFIQGQIEDKLSNKSFVSLTRYDILNDIFEIKQNLSEKGFTYLEKTPATSIVIAESTFVFTSFKNEMGNDEIGYLQLIGSIGDTNIYARHYSDVRLPEKAKTTLERDRKGKITNKIYYLKGTLTNSNPVDIDKKSILLLFEKEKRNSIKTFMKSTKNKARNIEEIITILDYSKTLK